MTPSADLFRRALGPGLRQLLERSDLSEILLDPDGIIRIEPLGGAIEDSGLRLDPAQATRILRLAAALNDTVIHPDSPDIAVELPNGARLQGWLPPVSPRPIFAIRCRTTRVTTLEEAIAAGTLTRVQCDRLGQAWQARQNIIICGGTGSGKTTLANALLNSLAVPGERLLILEDMPELHLTLPGTVTLRTTDHVSMRHLVKTALRLRPDRICIGEVRDGSALDLLKAWNTGHAGGLCTLHANDPAGALLRLEELVREVADHPPKSLISRTVNLILHIERDSSHQRRVTAMATLSPAPDGSWTLKQQE